MKTFCYLLFIFVLPINILGEKDYMVKQAKDENEKILHVVSTAHLDTQWRWTIQTTINNYIPNTLHGNFDLFEKFPNYVFSFEGAFRYMLAKEYYPAEYEKLKRYIQDGRWTVCGSWVDACDVNVPSPESIIRHVLYGNGFWEKEFGKSSVDIFLPDCFGFGYALPSIAVHCGLKGFSTQKLTWGSMVGIPFDIGIWEGVDGSQIFAALNPGAYNAHIKNDLSKDEGWNKTITKLGEKTGIFLGYKYIGVGDIGGAPNDETVANLEKAISSKNNPIKVISAPADKLYRDLADMNTDKLPIYKGELLMTKHATGCYTSQSAMKRWNRKNEMLAYSAEAAASVADCLGISNYPNEKLKEAWIRFLWHQFHDDLTGTSVFEAYTYSWNDELISLNQFGSVLNNAISKISAKLDTQTQGIPIIVFNPLSIEREDVVSGKIQFEEKIPQYFEVCDHEGKIVPSQLIKKGTDYIEICFAAKVPPLGYCIYEVRGTDKNPNISKKEDINVLKTGIENDRYKISFDENGDVSKIFDKELNKELLSSPIRLQMLDNPSYQWPAWEIEFDTLKKTPRNYVSGNPEISIIESGPVRDVIEIKRTTEGSMFRQVIMLNHVGDKDRIEFFNEVDWRTKGTLLKAVFPLTAANKYATYDLGLGTIDRENNNDKLYEVPAQKWTELTNQDKSHGVAILNDCKYGWDKPADNILRLTLIHTPKPDKHYTDQALLDLGHHKFTYALYSHKGDWREGKVYWKAERLNQPLLAYQSSKHSGILGKSFSFIKINSEQVSVKSVKKAENSDEYIIRVQEMNGSKTDNVEMSFVGKISSAKEVNGAEKTIRDLEIKDGKIIFSLGAYKPASFAVKLEKNKDTASITNCESVNLPFNVHACSPDDSKDTVDFDGKGNSIPAELFPNKLNIDDVNFVFGASDKTSFNAVACEGQEINLPSGNYNKLYILSSSTNGDISASFKIDDKSENIMIYDWNEFIGQWSSFIENGNLVEDINALKPPYIKDAVLAWVGTHKHKKNGSNDAYSFCYIFKNVIDIPKGAKKLTLPKNRDIRIFSVSVAQINEGIASPIQSLNDEFKGIPVHIKADVSDFIDSVQVPLSCSLQDAQIRYTIDGSSPTEKSELYVEPITVSKNCVLKAKAFKSGIENEYIAFREFRKVVPKGSMIPPSNLINGLDFNYYENAWSQLPDFDKLQPKKHGKAKEISCSARERDEDFGLKFVGFIKVPKDDIYKIYIKSDDGSKLFIGNEEIIDHDGLHGASEKIGIVALKAGYHPIRIIFFQHKGDFHLEAGFKFGSSQLEPFNSSILFSEKKD